MAVFGGVAAGRAGAAVAQDANKSVAREVPGRLHVAKKETINEVMKLNDAEGQKFRPIYQSTSRSSTLSESG